MVLLSGTHREPVGPLIARFAVDIGVPIPNPARMDFKRVGPDEAKILMDQEGYVLLDVRSIPEYTAEHAASAYNVPLLHKTPNGMISNADFSRAVQGHFPDRATKIITTCQMGARSIRAAAELRSLGYTDVVDLRGGFGSERDEAGNIVLKGWKDSGLPTEAGEQTGRGYKDIDSSANRGDTNRRDTNGPDPKRGPEPSANAPASCESPATVTAAVPGRPSRFAAANREVLCVKFGKELAGLKRRPFAGPLGDRIFKDISADAWELWVEHSKMLINEYRINPGDASAQALLLTQCEAFFFGEGARLPEGYVPQQQSK